MSMMMAIHDVLGLTDLQPNTTTNHVMSNLVASVLKHATLPHVSKRTVQKVRTISSDAETEMEYYWADILCASPEKRSTFPYIDNYKALAEREISLIAGTGLQLSASHRILVIGSGPLPLSAIELHTQTGAQVDQVDSSERAANKGKQVCKALGMDTHYYVGGGESITLSGVYDVILIAALAGSTKGEKQRIVDNVLPHLAAGGRIIIRSARGSRVLLYPEIKASSLKRMRALAEYHPDDYIINSVLIYGAQS